MAEDAPQEPISDATIDSLVNIVRAGEIMAGTLNVPVSEGVRLLMKSMQAMQRIQSSGVLFNMPTLPRVQ